MFSWARAIGKSFFDLAYPPICLHCPHRLEKGCPLFCRSCLDLLMPIDSKERCPYCFSAEFNGKTEKCCHHCLDHPLLLERVAAVFDYEGPAATLIKQLKYGGQLYLAKGAGAYLAAQFLSLDWPVPDVIVPMPMPLLRRFERGFNQSLLLAEAFAKFINRPVRDILVRKSGDFSQASLDYQQRLNLSSASFDIKKGVKLHGQSVLLIDDVMTTGSSLRCCAETLFPTFPQSIYALTVCRAM